MDFQNFLKLTKKFGESSDLTGQIRAAIAVGELFQSSLGPTGMEKLIFDREKNHLIATADGFKLIKEISVLTDSAIPKRLLKLGELQYKLIGDFTKTTICLAASWLRYFLEVDLKPKELKFVMRGFNRAVSDCVQLLPLFAIRTIDLEPRTASEFATAIFHQNLLSKLSIQATNHLTNIFGSQIPEWVDCIPRRQHFSSRDYYPQNFHTIISPGGHIIDSYLFDGIILKKDFTASEHALRMRDARIVLTREKLYFTKQDQNHVGAVYHITTPQDLARFNEHEQDPFPHLVSNLRKLNANILVTEKGISDHLLGKLEQCGIFVVRRAKIKQMIDIAKATGATLLTCTKDVSPRDVGVSPLVYTERIRGDWRVFIASSAVKASSFVIRCSNYEVGNEVRRNIKSALRTTLGSLFEGAFLPGAGSWQALAVNLCNHNENIPLAARDAAAFGFSTILQVLGGNLGGDPIDLSLTLIAQNSEQADSYSGFHFKSKIIKSIAEIGIYDGLRAVQLAIDHARQFVCEVMNVDRVFHYEKKPHRD